MLPTKTRGGQRDQVEQTTGEKIKANQQRLHAQRQADGLKKWENGDGGNANGKDKAIKRFESYRREEQLPRDVEQRRVSCINGFGGSCSSADLRRRAEADGPHSNLRLDRTIPYLNDQECHKDGRRGQDRSADQLSVSWTDCWKEGRHGEFFSHDLKGAVLILSHSKIPTRLLSVQLRSGPRIRGI